MRPLASGSEWLILRHTCARDETKSVISRLHVLPEVDVRVVEDIAMEVEVVEALHATAQDELGFRCTSVLPAHFA